MIGHSLTLDDNWDLQIDITGRIVECTGAYAIAQNVANKVRLFKNDSYFYPDDGIPHFDVSFGMRPAAAVIRSKIVSAAESVEGVKNAKIEDLDIDRTTRQLTGDIQLTLEDGANADVNF